jgi:hypothetical protein
MAYTYDRETNNKAKRDSRYRKNQFDKVPIVDIKQSILEMRKVYSNLTDHEFAAWYSKRFKVSAGDVLQVLDKERRNG